MLFRKRKEWRTDVCDYIKNNWRHSSKWKKPVTTDDTAWLHSYELSRIGNSEGNEIGNFLDLRGEGGRHEKSLVTSTQSFFLGNKYAMLDYYEGYTAL